MSGGRKIVEGIIGRVEHSLSPSLWKPWRRKLFSATMIVSGPLFLIYLWVVLLAFCLGLCLVVPVAVAVDFFREGE